MDTIAICAVLQDAAPRILEWIAFHRLIGVDRFVLYDLGSTDGTAALVARSRFGRQASVIGWPGNRGSAAAYADFVANHANRFTWAAIIHLDEFIHPLDTDSVSSLLPRYDRFSAVVLRRLTFGMPGQHTRTGQLVIGSYASRVASESPLNGAALTLLRVSALQGVDSTASGFVLAGDVCNARGEHLPPDAPLDRVRDDVMVVNRYPVRPAAERRVTVAGGIGTVASFAAALEAGTHSDRQLRAAEAAATVPDRRIMRFIPRLRAMLHDTSMAVQPRLVRPRLVQPGLAQPSLAQSSLAQPPAVPTPTSAVPPLLLGIGIATYNRRQILAETLDRVLRHTRHKRTIVAVADDGSTDGTLDMLRERQVLTVTGRNMSIAWNKNRALFLLSEMLRCDVVVLLEDDAYPSQDNWEQEWMQAAIRWGHANVAGDWLAEHFVSGAGTAEDPILSKRVTAHCAVFSREALLFGGYFDPRFRGYGHEHVEHSRRLIRLGYGGVDQHEALFNLVSGGISYHNVQSTFDVKAEQAEQNLRLAHELFLDFSYRAPWRNETEAKQFRDEMRASLSRAAP